MRISHAWIGYSIVAAFGLMALWGLVAWGIRRGPGRAFWWLLAFLQVTLIVQLVAGLVLLARGGGLGILHYLYGVAFPATVLVGAHWVARETFRHRPWMPFAFAGFVAFGLTLRAAMTGLGIG